MLTSLFKNKKALLLLEVMPPLVQDGKCDSFYLDITSSTNDLDIILYILRSILIEFIKNITNLLLTYFLL
jgi:hypothetical protein